MRNGSKNETSREANDRDGIRLLDLLMPAANIFSDSQIASNFRYPPYRDLIRRNDALGW